MTADIRTAAQRDCVTCGKSYEPTDENQKFCEHLCKRQNYAVRRFGFEYGLEWRHDQERKRARYAPQPARVTPTREQIAIALAKQKARDWDSMTGVMHVAAIHAEYFNADAVLALMAGLAEGEGT